MIKIIIGVDIMGSWMHQYINTSTHEWLTEIIIYNYVRGSGQTNL